MDLRAFLGFKKTRVLGYGDGPFPSHPTLTDLRLDGVTGLAAGDHVQIVLAPDLDVEGVIAWSVWHKAGVTLSQPLAERDAVYMYLADQAAKIEQARTRAVIALAQQYATRAQQPDTD